MNVEMFCDDCPDLHKLMKSNSKNRGKE